MSPDAPLDAATRADSRASVLVGLEAERLYNAFQDPLEGRHMVRLLFAVPFVLLAFGASAQQRPGQDACARDVTRFCRAYINQGDMVVLSCLQANRARISRACNKVMIEHGQ
jgi:hypothetical protein